MWTPSATTYAADPRRSRSPARSSDVFRSGPPSPRRGFRAVGIYAAAVAARRLEDAPGALHEYALVVTDQQMPALVGTELARWVRDRRGPPVLLVSAFADDALRARAHAAGVVEVPSSRSAIA